MGGGSELIIIQRTAAPDTLVNRKRSAEKALVLFNDGDHESDRALLDRKLRGYKASFGLSMHVS